MDPLLLRICPATLPRRILECLLPSDCREIIKYIGLWRTRDYLENFVYLDIFDDRNGLLEALNQWDSIVEEQYNFKAVQFDGRAGLTSGTFDGTTFSNRAKSLTGFSFFARKDKLPTIPENQ